MANCIACLTLFGLQCLLAEASTAEGWGARPHFEAPAPTHGPPAVLEEEAEHAHAAASEQVMLTAGGSFHRQSSSIVRRQHGHQDSEGGDGHHHHVHQGKIEAMFNEIDTDGDGEISNHEMKVFMKEIEGHSKIPKDLQDVIKNVEDTRGGGMTFKAFKDAAHVFSSTSFTMRKVKKETARRLHTMKDESDEDKNSPHHNHHVGSVQKHQHANMDDELLQKKAREDPDGPADDEQAGTDVVGASSTDPADPRASWVSCGGHKAPNCDACTKTDATGATVFDHGGEWCNGDCAYDGACKVKGTITVNGTVPGEALGYSTSAAPDLLNPEMTPEDTAAVNTAAEDAIKEENIEAADKTKKEEEEAEDAKFSMGKFWLLVIVIFSVILGVCAIISVVALIVFCLMANPGPPPGKDEAAAPLAAEGEVAEEPAAAS